VTDAVCESERLAPDGLLNFDMSDTASTHPGTAETPLGGGVGVRVVLVGETGLDGVLRREDGFETVRTRTALEAVGEVASPAQPAARTVLVVGADAEPNGSLPAFLDAVRRADPAVRVVRAGGDADRGGYDGVIHSASALVELRGLAGVAARVSGDAELKPVAPDPAREHAARGEVEPKSLPDTEEAAPAGPEHAVTLPLRDAPSVSGTDGLPAAEGLVGDGALLALLDASRGKLLRVALGMIAQRVGVEEVRFVDRDEADTETEPVPSVPVSWGGARLGVIRAASVSAETLVPHASWLGGWLALHDRQQALRRAAFTDPLTGAWNRRYFDGFLEAAIDRARENRRTITVLVFDIDEFKRYNDDYGHPAGDEILIEVVRALKSSVRPSDRVCRIGGDEFAVVFDDPEGPRERGSRPPESVYVLAKRVQRQIGEKKFPKLGADAPGSLTISGGLAAFPWDGHDAETLLDRADQLALASKKQGKNAIMLGPGAERVCKHDGDDLLD